MTTGGDAAALEHAWEQWDPGVPLEILHTEYASVVRPIVAFIDEARRRSDQQIVVLIPVVVPTHFRYRLLHNQIDRVLSRALRDRTDLVVARVAMPLTPPPVGEAPVQVERGAAAGEGPGGAGTGARRNEGGSRG